MRQLFVGECIIYHIAPSVNFGIVQAGRYAFFIFGLGAAILYHNKILPSNISNWIIKTLIVLCFIGTINSILLPTYYITLQIIFFIYLGFFVVLIGIYQVYSAVRERRPFSKLIAISFLVVAVFFVNDLLKSRQIIETEYVINYGLLAYIILQSYISNKLISIEYLLLQ